MQFERNQVCILNSFSEMSQMECGPPGRLIDVVSRVSCFPFAEIKDCFFFPTCTDCLFTDFFFPSHCTSCPKKKKKEEQAQRAASRQSQMGPPAPGGRNEGFPAGSVFDPTRFQDANGEGSEAGNYNSPYNRDRSLFPVLRASMQEDENL